MISVAAAALGNLPSFPRVFFFVLSSSSSSSSSSGCRRRRRVISFLLSCRVASCRTSARNIRVPYSAPLTSRHSRQPCVVVVALVSTITIIGRNASRRSLLARVILLSLRSFGSHLSCAPAQALQLLAAPEGMSRPLYAIYRLSPLNGLGAVVHSFL